MINDPFLDGMVQRELMSVAGTPLKTLPSKPTRKEVVKDYYLIFSEGSPPAITESWKAAEHWQRLGCTIETYQRIITEKSNAPHHSCGTCCNHR